jgi:MFS family permease
MRFLLDAAEAGFFPGVILYLTYWYPSRRRAKIVALFMSAIPLAGLLGNPLSGWIMNAFSGASGLQGWQWMFVIEAVKAVLAGVVVVFPLDSNIVSAKWLAEAEKGSLSEEITADALHGKKGPHSVLEIIKNGHIWVLCLTYFALTMGQYGLTFRMPTLIDTTGVRGNLKVGLLSAIPFLCAIVAMNLCGRSSDRLRERRWHLIVPAMVAALSSTVVASYAHNTTLSIIFLSLAAAGVLSCTPLFWSLPTAFLSGIAAAVGTAVINSVGNLAGFVSLSLIGYLKDATHSTGTGMYMLSAILLLGAVTVWSIPSKLVNH